MEKWKKSVIHLECATDKEHILDRVNRMKTASRELGEGIKGNEESAEEIRIVGREIRYHGTAIFLAHKGKRYLLTARHVVWDEREAKRWYQENFKRIKELPENFRENSLHDARSI
jgi:hypothetical protein